MKTGSNLKKKILAVLIAMLALTFSLVGAANAANPVSDFEFDKDSGAITKYIGTSTEVIIPDNIDGTKVTSLENAFKDNKTVTNVVIPEGVTDLSSTFSGCTELSNVNIPKSATNLYNTFEKCTKLTEAPVIPNGVTNLECTFFDCSNLVKAPVIPDSVTTMKRTFDYCTKLAEAPVIPDGIDDLFGTFRGCAITKTPVIPKKVTRLFCTFGYCASLEELDVPDNITYIHNTTENCTKLTKITIRNKDCKIEEEKIPSGAKFIGHDPSTAKMYADNKHISFESLDEPAEPDGDTVIDFPDDVLKTYLLGVIIDNAKLLDSNGDKEISISEAETAKKLILSSTEHIKNIDGLQYFTNLEELCLAVSDVKDIKPLSKLTKLTKLDLHNNQIQDISPLSDLINLNSLDLYCNQISDISSLSELRSLTHLNLNRNNVESIRVLSNFKNLSDLDLSLNSEIKDITQLSELTNLTKLDLGYLNLIKDGDISPLSGLTNLTDLDLSFVHFTDLTPLSNLQVLTNLNLESNEIKDIRPLSGLKSSLKMLNLKSNNLIYDETTDNAVHLNELDFKVNDFKGIQKSYEVWVTAGDVFVTEGGWPVDEDKITTADFNNKIIQLQIYPTIFEDGTLNKDNFILENAPAGLSVSSADYVDDKTVDLHLTYNGEPLENDFNELRIIIKKEELKDFIWDLTFKDGVPDIIAGASGNWSEVFEMGDAQYDTDYTVKDGYIYVIKTAKGLAYVADVVNKGDEGMVIDAVELADDIVLSSHYWTPIGNNEHPFKGTFDGKNHKITGLYIVISDTPDDDLDYVGLFGKIEGATIQNLGVDNCAIYSAKDSAYVGGLAGYAGENDGVSNSTIINCYTTGDVTGGNSAYVGGLVGFASSVITNCYSTVNVTGGDSAYVGGLVGFANAYSISNCYATGDVTGGGALVGGLVGFNNGSTITNGYWNRSATQTVNGTERTEDKKGVGDGNDPSTKMTSSDMQKDDFAQTLNKELSDGMAAWGRDNAKNNGYPVLVDVGEGSGVSSSGTGEPIEVILAEGSEGTAGNQKISGLESGKIYKVTVDPAGTTPAIMYTTATGTLTTEQADKGALGDGVTEISELTNGTTYKVEAYIPSDAPLLTVTVTKGIAYCSTKAIVEDAGELNLAVNITKDEIQTPKVGDIIDETDSNYTNFVESYKSGDNIIRGATKDNYLQVYAVTNDKKVVKFYQKQLTADDIFAANAVENTDYIVSKDGKPYIIKTGLGLAWLADQVNNHDNTFEGKTVELEKDIVLSDHDWTPIGYRFATDAHDLVKTFNGIFNGKNHKVTDLKIGTSDSPNSKLFVGALFGVTSGGTIENTVVEDCMIYSSGDDGGLVGENGGVIKNCYSTGKICNNEEKSCVGGLVGINQGGEITDCYSEVNTTGSGKSACVGGLVGKNESEKKTTITNCYATGIVKGGVDKAYVGGLVGKNESDATITNCYAAGNATGGSEAYVGGLVGYNKYEGTRITNCYAAGNATGGSGAKVGGLVGYNKYKGIRITNCYAAGNATGGSEASVGGLVGKNNSETIISCGYWNKSAQQTVNSIERSSEDKKGVGDGNDLSTGMESSDMQKDAFAQTLNKNQSDITGLSDGITLAAWGRTDAKNSGYPVLAGIGEGSGVSSAGTGEPSPAEQANAAIAKAKGLLPDSFTAVEGNHNNLLEFLNAIEGMSDTGVTLSLESSNANVENDGKITHTDSEQSGNVTVKINKANGTEQSKTITVTVPKHTLSPEEQAKADIATAKAALDESDFKYIEGDSKSSVTNKFILPLTGENGTTISWAENPENSAVTINAETGEVTVKRPAHGSGDATVGLRAIISKNGQSDTKDLSVTVKEAAASGGGHHSSSHSSAASQNDKSQVAVDGKKEAAAETKTEEQGDSTITTVALDTDKITQSLKKGSTVTIPATNQTSDVVVGELNGELVKEMEERSAVVEVQTARARYTLPAQQINIEAVSEEIGLNVELKDIKVTVQIAEAPDQDVRVVESAAKDGNLSIVVPPVSFEVQCSYGNKKVSVNRFNNYVQKLVAIPEGVDPNKITTGVVLKHDGTVSHVPTEVIVIDGNYYAKINSLTNSTYSVIWNPIEFADLENHWAKEAVNDMGSRLVVNGYDKDTFIPDKDITRAEFAKIVIAALGLGNPQGQIAYSDVAKEAWYYDYVRLANDYGLIKGYPDGTFKPDNNISREEAMAIINRSMKIAKMDTTISTDEVSRYLAKFKDSNEVGSWAQDYAALCIKTGLVSGYDGNINAQDNISRAETATIVRKLLKKAELI